MKTHEDLQKNTQYATTNGLLNVEKIGVFKKTFKHLKKYLYIGGLAGIGLLFNGCFPGYMSSEPTYVENSRPSQPSSLHVWVDGNWVWSRSTKTYVYRDGYWKKTHHHRKYVAGHWNSGSKGHKWAKGHWENN